MANNRTTTSDSYVSNEQLRVGLYVFIDLPWFQHPFTLNSFRIANDEQVKTLRGLGESRFRYAPERSDAALSPAAAGTSASDASPGQTPGREAQRNDALAGEAGASGASGLVASCPEGLRPADTEGDGTDPSGGDEFWSGQPACDESHPGVSGRAGAPPGESPATAGLGSGSVPGSGPPAKGSPGVKHERMQALSERRLRIEQVDKAFVKSSNILRHLNRNLLSKPNETLQEMGLLVDQMVLAFLENPDVTLHVMGEKCGGDETYSHSLNVSVLCMMLTKGLNFSPEQARILGLGALLHDIGLADVPDRVLKKRPDEYTKPERELRAMHCEFGLRIGKQIGLPPHVLPIIYQHHEMADGSGYPLGLKLEKICLAARVVAIVNCYDNLCNPVDIAQAMTPHEALSVMFGQRRGKFDAAILQQMIRSLGVYPPGSIVTLSNDMIAMVMSVNPAKPLRPWVMLYDKDVPKDDAPLLDLEHENEIVIAQALRPALLPPATYAYLSPRKRVSYFFDSSTTTVRGGE